MEEVPADENPQFDAACLDALAKEHPGTALREKTICAVDFYRRSLHEDPLSADAPSSILNLLTKVNKDSPLAATQILTHPGTSTFLLRSSCHLYLDV